MFLATVGKNSNVLSKRTLLINTGRCITGFSIGSGSHIIMTNFSQNYVTNANKLYGRYCLIRSIQWKCKWLCISIWGNKFIALNENHIFSVPRELYLCGRDNYRWTKKDGCLSPELDQQWYTKLWVDVSDFQWICHSILQPVISIKIYRQKSVCNCPEFSIRFRSFLNHKKMPFTMCINDCLNIGNIPKAIKIFQNVWLTNVQRMAYRGLNEMVDF